MSKTPPDPIESTPGPSDSWLSFGKDLLVVIIVLLIVVTAVLMYGPSVGHVYGEIANGL